MTQEIKTTKQRGSMRKGMPARAGAGRPPGAADKTPRARRTYSIVLPTVPAGAGPAVVSEVARPFVAKAMATLAALMDSPNEDIASAAAVHLLDRFAGMPVKISVSDVKSSSTSTIWGAPGNGAPAITRSTFQASAFRAMVRELHGLADDSDQIEERMQTLLRSGMYSIIPDQIPIARARNADAVDVESTTVKE